MKMIPRYQHHSFNSMILCFYVSANCCTFPTSLHETEGSRGSVTFGRVFGAILGNFQNVPGVPFTSAHVQNLWFLLSYSRPSCATKKQRANLKSWPRDLSVVVQVAMFPGESTEEYRNHNLGAGLEPSRFISRTVV